MAVYFQPDPVMRMIEMLGDFMRRLFELPIETLAEDGERRLDEAARRFAGMPLAMARGLSSESLAEVIREDERVLALAELLGAAAEIKRELPFPDEEDTKNAIARDEGIAMALWLQLGIKSSMAHRRDEIFVRVSALKNRGVVCDEALMQEFLTVYQAYEA